MNWIQVTIYTTAEGIEPLCGTLYELGVTGVEIEDAKDFQDFLENNRQYWDYVDEELLQQKSGETCVKLYLSDNAAGLAQLRAVESAVAALRTGDTDGVFGRLAISRAGMNEEDWANNWKQYFKPIPVGERILIRPEWEEISDPGGRIVFTVNPGMSFGTGSHHTTRLCIEQLERYVAPGCDMLDLGCGSGILFVISLLLGAKYAAAVDIDPNAADIARANAALNGIDPGRCDVYAGNVLEDEALSAVIGARRYDVVCANIVADVIILLAERVPPLLKAGGVFIASGVIDERVDEVARALAQSGLCVREIIEEGGWAAMVCTAAMD